MPLNKHAFTAKAVWADFFFKMSQEVVMSFRVAGMTLCDIPCVSEGMSVQDRRGTKVAVSMGEAGNSRLFQVSQEVMMLFRTAGVALCNIPCLSEDTSMGESALHSTLYTPHFTIHTLHSTIYTQHFTLYTPHFTLYTAHFAL